MICWKVAAVQHGCLPLQKEQRTIEHNLNIILYWKSYKMSPAKTKDPKSYIQNKAPPIPSHQGLRIQARSDTHYNCETPCRQDVFLSNYGRRQKQKNEQGYNSPNWKPYQMLGEPMYLDDRKLILSALGQMDEVKCAGGVWGRWMERDGLICPIANVANSKRHQRLDEILIIFTRTIQEISKVVWKKTMSETRAFITSLWNALITASVCCANRFAFSFAGVLHDRVFWKQLCWFLPCSVGKNKIKISSSRWWRLLRFQLATSPIGNHIRCWVSQYFLMTKSWYSAFWDKWTRLSVLGREWRGRG